MVFLPELQAGFIALSKAEAFCTILRSKGHRLSEIGRWHRVPLMLLSVPVAALITSGMEFNGEPLLRGLFNPFPRPEPKKKVTLLSFD